MAERGLVMASDPELLDALLRIAAAAGCELERAVDATQARRSWTRAPVVLLDAPAAHQCIASRLPRRRGVVVAARGEPPPAVWQQAVAVGADHVVALPEAEEWLVAILSEAVEERSGSGCSVAVVGGRGGAGASVLAAAVAVTAARDGGRALLVDCDPLGGGLDLALGAEDLDGVRWPQVDVAGGRIPAAALHAALPSPDLGGRMAGALAVLSCDRAADGPTAGAVTAVVQAGRRAGDTVVCDLPRHPTGAARAALSAADLAVLVVSADVRACAAAGRVATGLADSGAAVQLIVRGPSPGGVDGEEVARALGLPLLATMRAEPGLARAVERGELPVRPRGPLAAAARTVLVEARRAAGVRQ